MLERPFQDEGYVMRRVMCLVGIHRWEHHLNRELGGKNAGYDLCSHCGREKKSYEEGGNPGFKGPLVG